MITDVDNRVHRLQQAFQEQFSAAPAAVVRAPGRVELIGGHTDYNDGFVMPAAIDRDVMIAVGPAEGSSTVTAHSLNYQQTSVVHLDHIQKAEDAPWSNYIRGVLDEMQKAGLIVPALNMAVEGNVPLGSGLSSSAALEVATAVAVLDMTGGHLGERDLALLCQRAENRFVGVNCGIMDQFISIAGQEGKAMFLDCRSLDYQFAMLPRGTRIVVADSRKPRTLAGSEYNVRRAQCEEAVDILKRHITGIKALRDVTPEDLDQYGRKLPEVVRKRARHVVHENQRVLNCLRALHSGDASRFGEFLNQSHASARDFYEISCDELNWLQEAAVSVTGCLGSRLMGGGFGGSTVSLVREESVEEFQEVVAAKYRAKSGKDPEVAVLSAADGAGKIS